MLSEPTKVGTSILFVNESGEVLLCLRDDIARIPFPNCWDVPGGGLEAGETPLACITREMQEEIGVTLDQPTLFHRFELADRTEYTFWQRATFDIQETRLTEGQRLQWFSQEQIAGMEEREIAFGFKPIMLRFFEERPFET